MTQSSHMAKSIPTRLRENIRQTAVPYGTLLKQTKFNQMEGDGKYRIDMLGSDKHLGIQILNTNGMYESNC